MQEPSIISTNMSALSCEHNLVDEDDPIAKFWVRKVVDAAGSRASTPRVKRPITLEILKKILWAANPVLAEFDASIMRAVFSLAFHACVHIGEMVSSNGQPQHTILAQNVAIRASEVTVALVSFKHNKGNTPNTDLAKHRPDPCLCGSQENKWRGGRSGFAYNAA